MAYFEVDKSNTPYVTAESFNLSTAPHMVLRGSDRLFAQLSRMLHPIGRNPKIGSIADVHGNAAGLESEIRFCRQEGVDRMVASGDFIDRIRIGNRGEALGADARILACRF